MDEEDGRPGALAAQAGQWDVRVDALPLSLRPEVSQRLNLQFAEPEPAAAVLRGRNGAARTARGLVCPRRCASKRMQRQAMKSTAYRAVILQQPGEAL